MDVRLTRVCESYQPEVVRLTQRLAGEPGRVQARRTAEQVQEALENLGYDLVFRDRVGNVVGISAGSVDGPVLLLLSFMDPERPRHRGSVQGSDSPTCIGALATHLFAGRVLQETSPFFRGILIIAASVAGRGVGDSGATHLLRRTLPDLRLEPSLLVQGEPTGLELRQRVPGPEAADSRVTALDQLGVHRVIHRAVEALRAEGFSIGEPRSATHLLPGNGVPTLYFGPGEQQPAGSHPKPARADEIGRSLLGIAVLAEAVLRSPIRTVLSSRERCV